MKFACLVTVLHSVNSFYDCCTVIAAVLWKREDHVPFSLTLDHIGLNTAHCLLFRKKNLDSQTFKMLSETLVCLNTFQLI